MKKAIYYAILIILIICVLIAVPATLDVIFGIDLHSVGVKGLTAGAGIAVIMSRKGLFRWFDKLFVKK